MEGGPRVCSHDFGNKKSLISCFGLGEVAMEVGPWVSSRDFWNNISFTNLFFFPGESDLGGKARSHGSAPMIFGTKYH